MNQTALKMKPALKAMDLPNPFKLNPNETSAAFIDGPGLYWSFKNATGGDYRLDFMRLKQLIAENSDTRGISYYTVYPPIAKGQDDTNKLRPLVDFLGFNGYRVETVDARSYETPLGTRTKGSITLPLGLDAFNAAVLGDAAGHILLFVNDEDYVPLVLRLQAQNVKVTVISTRARNIVSTDLLYGLDRFIDLEDIREDLIRRD